MLHNFNDDSNLPPHRHCGRRHFEKWTPTFLKRRYEMKQAYAHHLHPSIHHIHNGQHNPPEHTSEKYQPVWVNFDFFPHGFLLIE